MNHYKKHVSTVYRTWTDIFYRMILLRITAAVFSTACVPIFGYIAAYGQQTPGGSSPGSNKSIVLDKLTYNTNWETLIITSRVHAHWSPEVLGVHPIQEFTYQSIDNKLPSILSRVINTLPATQLESLFQFLKTYNVQRGGFNDIQTNTTRTYHIPDKNLFGLTLIYKTSLRSIITNHIFSQFSHVSPPPAVAPLSAEAGIAAFDNNTVSQKNTLAHTIIFAADNPLPVLDNTESKPTYFIPKLIPHVFSQDGTVVYSPEYFDKTSGNNPAAMPFVYIYADTLISRKLMPSTRVVVPIALNSSTNGDLIITDGDAQKLLGLPETREAITKGHVVFVLPSRTRINTSGGAAPSHLFEIVIDISNDDAFSVSNEDALYEKINSQENP